MRGMQKGIEFVCDQRVLIVDNCMDRTELLLGHLPLM